MSFHDPVPAPVPVPVLVPVPVQLSDYYHFPLRNPIAIPSNWLALLALNGLDFIRLFHCHSNLSIQFNAIAFFFHLTPLHQTLPLWNCSEIALERQGPVGYPAGLNRALTEPQLPRFLHNWHFSEFFLDCDMEFQSNCKKSDQIDKHAIGNRNGFYFCLQRPTDRQTVRMSGSAAEIIIVNTEARKQKKNEKVTMPDFYDFFPRTWAMSHFLP